MGTQSSKPISKFTKSHIVQTLRQCEKRFQEESRHLDKQKDKFLQEAKASMLERDVSRARECAIVAHRELNDSMKYLRISGRVSTMANALELTSESAASIKPILNSPNPIFITGVTSIEIGKLCIHIKDFLESHYHFNSKTTERAIDFGFIVSDQKEVSSSRKILRQIADELTLTDWSAFNAEGILHLLEPNSQSDSCSEDNFFSRNGTSPYFIESN